LERFFAARGVEEFSRDLALAWVDEACGFFDKEQTGTLKPTDVYVFRVAQMLGDYAVHGAVRCRYSRSISRLAGGGVDAVARFQAWLRTADRAASTVRTYTTAAGEFVAFLDTRGGMARCDGGAVEAFVATSAGVGARNAALVTRPADTRGAVRRVGRAVGWCSSRSSLAGGVVVGERPGRWCGVAGGCCSCATRRSVVSPA
jgi:hypothetical protein